MSEVKIPKVGDAITVSDELGVLHDALVTVYFGGERPNGALNCVFVSSDVSKSDPYGRQTERLSSVSHKSGMVGVPGRFWE